MFSPQPLPPERPPEREYALVVDVKLKRPAGLWIQIVNGGEVELLDLFPTECILQHETPEMELRHGTLAQWQRFVDVAKRGL